MMPDNVQQFLLNENIRLATEVDLLSADLKYLREVMTTMSKLLAQAEVPVPTEELAMLAKQHDERVANIVNMSTAIAQFQQSLLGMRTGEEVAVEIDRGKTLVIRLQGNSEPDEEGFCKLFFELNGQARVVRVPKAGIAGAVSRHPKVDEQNANHLGAPMPGTIVTVSVQVGQRVEKGDALVSLEAMKMETVLRADREAVVKSVHVKPGDRVASKDLLIEFG